MANVIVIPNGPAVQIFPGENTLEAARQAGIATTQAGIATAAVGAVLQTVEVTLQPDDGLVDGAWYGEFFVSVDTEFTLVRHWIYLGTGTANLSINIDDDNYAGPFAVTTTADSDALTLTVLEGQRVSFQLDDVTGSPGGIAVKMEGLPA